MSPLPTEDLLRRVLALERDQGFDNRAMMGGISTFAQELHTKAPAGSVVPEAALLLAHYDGDDRRSRAGAVAAAQALLDSNPATPAIQAPVDRPKRTRSKSDSAPAAKMKTRTAKTPPADANQDVLGLPLNHVPGVAEKRATQLRDVGFESVGDVLYYFPREHLDYRRRDGIRSLRYGQRATLVAQVESVRVRRIRKNLSITIVTVIDDSGHVSVEWFNQPYLEKSFQPGRRVAISGELDFFNGRKFFKPRDYEWLDDEELTHAARLVPIYPLKKGLFQKSLRTLISNTIETFADRVPEHIPRYVSEEFDLPDIGTALRRYHFPADESEAFEGRRRLAFDEVLSIQLGLRIRKQEMEEGGRAPALPLSDSERDEFLDLLPFLPTQAQTRVMTDVEKSLAATRPMSRLIQGDVGSGKTVVAALALYVAAKRGCRSALMAPTEILAQQHHRSISAWLAPADIHVSLLTGSTPAAQREEVLDAVASGNTDVLIGTHALFQDDVLIDKLGVVVVDEQHRFGVEQRTRLRQKGESPHLLAMTATPIPRTLQLTLYGDLDISIIDELPPGRVPVETRLVSAVHQAYRVVEEEVGHGRQAFVVCPVIDESLDADMKSAVAEHKRLQKDVFPRLNVGLLHGRLKPREKDGVLVAFRDGELDILVATSVVEVGIDIPNATTMVIRDAHRFGLAQLHQLRGRIGRGGVKSYCLLVSQADEGPTLERLQAVVATQDGFKLAEKDLELRGPGEFWGTRQSGMPDLRVAGPGDAKVMEMAKCAVDMILACDPRLEKNEHQRLRGEVNRFWSQEAALH